MNKQTSVEWLIEQIDFDANTRCFSQPEWFAIYQKAKAMHKKEIIDTFFEGAYGGDIISGEQYYNETFGGQDNE